MEENTSAPLDVTGQTLQVIIKILEVQRQQSSHQNEWHNWTAFHTQKTKDDDPEAFIEAFEKMAIQITQPALIVQ
ncbi:hypothetical protein Y1Q_0004012 [Alligator mississippiensis]|uniref:Uncharacterized protein n=1 Tax=Alligator mississippiensis TaxID=8496 RepID=A0A151PI23_ALLMI|nr:hypothetical protein Y1Q_0004012 [Alligator mississippiensis]